LFLCSFTLFLITLLQFLLFFSCFSFVSLFIFSQIAYMDFIDFNGNAGPIYCRLPRIRYIKNEDFLHLQSLDLRLEKRKYGLLPVSSFQLFFLCCSTDCYNSCYVFISYCQLDRFFVLSRIIFLLHDWWQVHVVVVIASIYYSSISHFGDLINLSVQEVFDYFFMFVSCIFISFLNSRSSF
jgi:hypothetical protein